MQFHEMSDEQQARFIRTEGEYAAQDGKARGSNPYRDGSSWMRDAWWSGFDEELARDE